MNISNRILRVFQALFSFAIIYCAEYGEIFEFDIADVSIVNTDGTAYQFTLEVAASRKQRARGLMFRQNLAGDQGMIFIFPESRIAEMWMKHTPLRLDMLFADDCGTIQDVKPNRSPNSESIISTSEKVRYVVELKGGASTTFGIQAGSKIEFPDRVLWCGKLDVSKAARERPQRRRRERAALQAPFESQI